MIKFKVIEKEEAPPEMIGICTCGYSAFVSTLETQTVGWEDPTIELICPKCEDGGCIDDFIYPNSTSQDSQTSD